MKLIGAVSTAALFLLLGLSVPVDARQDGHDKSQKQEQPVKPAKQDQEAKPQQQQHSQQQAKGQQEQQQKQQHQQAQAEKQQQRSQQEVKGQQEQQQKQQHQQAQSEKQQQHSQQQAKGQQEQQQKQQHQQQAQSEKQQQQRSQQEVKGQQEQQQKQQHQQAQSEKHQQQRSQQEVKGRQEQQQNQHQQQQQQAKNQRDLEQRSAQQAHSQHVKMQTQQEQHRQQTAQRSAWEDRRAHNWKTEHRDWQQRGGYNGYRIPEERYRGYFGPSHAFRIYSYPVVVVGGYPRFQYGGFYFNVVDPWPEYWPNNWYANDDVYVDYSGDGYYLYNRRYPRDRIAISVNEGDVAQNGAWGSAWQDHRASNWQSEHRDWQERGGYNGYRIPEDRYRGYFGPDHAFRISTYPVSTVGGFPRFQYGGFSFSVVDPWPEYWSNDWYDNDDMYIDYSGDGYYLYNRRYPRDRVAITVYAG